MGIEKQPAKVSIREGLDDFMDEKIPNSNPLKHREALENGEGVPIDMEPLSTGVSLGNCLKNECMNFDGKYNSIDELHALMEEHIKKYNESRESFMRAEAWKYNEKEKTLSHATGSGRLSITIGDNLFNADLYSPKYLEGEHPYYSITWKDGKLLSTLIDVDILEYGNRTDRLYSVSKYLSESVGFENILQASDYETGSNLIRARETFFKDNIEILQKSIERSEYNISRINNGVEVLSSIEYLETEIDGYYAEINAETKKINDLLETEKQFKKLKSNY